MSFFDICMLIGIPSIIFAIYQSLVAFISSRHKKKVNDSDALKEGVQALLRDRLLQGYLHHKECGYIDIAEKENLNNIYKAYHNLGQNGVMDKIYSEIMELPVCKDIK